MKNESLVDLYFGSNEAFENVKNSIEEYVFNDLLKGNPPNNEQRIHIANICTNKFIEFFGRSWLKRFQIRIRFILNEDTKVYQPNIILELRASTK